VKRGESVRRPLAPRLFPFGNVILVNVNRWDVLRRIPPISASTPREYPCCEIVFGEETSVVQRERGKRKKRGASRMVKICGERSVYCLPFIVIF
jgi:hypothetical protein